MFLSDRRSALKLASTVTVIGVLIIFFPLEPRHITDDDRAIQLNLPSQKTPTEKSIPSVTTIPEEIWYKLGPRGLNTEAQERIDSCLNNNPAYQVEFMTDPSGDQFVRDNLNHRPDIVDAFLALQVPILKADMLRYLLLLNEGGIYSDLDVYCGETRLQDWIPEQYKQNASLVVGWEFDIGWGDNFFREFATWTIMAKPGFPHLLMVLDDIMEGLQEKTIEHNITLADMTWDMVGDVVDLTGPRRMTRSIMKSLKATLGDDFDEKSVHTLSEPKLVGDVLILPGYSFALSSNRYQPEDKQGPALVTHHFDGSWKNDHGGETVDVVVS